MLWTYCITPHSTTRESSFRLTYGTKYVIPAELDELNKRVTTSTDFQTNNENLREGLETVEEIKSEAAIKEATIKQKSLLVLRRNQNDSEEGKFVANWERPYHVFHKTGT